MPVGADLDAVDEFVEQLLDDVGAAVLDGVADGGAEVVERLRVGQRGDGPVELAGEGVALDREFVAAGGQFGEAGRADGLGQRR